MKKDETQYRFVIVGCGVISAVHVRAILGRPDATIAGLVDRAESRASAVADEIAGTWGRPRPEVFTDVKTALERVSPDVVVITTPNGSHAELARLGLAAGAHVIIEKPLDIDLAAARGIVESSERAHSSGQVVSVISQHRFDSASRVVARALGEGKFGRLTSAVASIGWWRSQAYYDSAGWRGTWEVDGGGSALQQGVHTVDLMLAFFGRPARIHAHTALLAHERIAVEDTCTATIRFESGALGVVHMTTAAYPGVSARIQVHGTQGSAVIEDDILTYFHTADARELDEGIPAMGLGAGGNQVGEAVSTATDTVAGGGADAHALQYGNILEAVESGHRPEVGPREAFDALATIRGFYISATLGEEIDFKDVVSGRYDDLVVRTGSAG